ncbi:hypothetical protein AGOR_G00240040 [Albula goreensis]|uniref:Uncharacterized protein n=1 Tax=Albula goreensis TaxID=1534307 RepID=A0A8T3CJY3_9TELE|nr:hypothetical protein AGOR_G00240040 [Albula goreensis]
MHYSRRVAIWLYRLHVALAKKCFYFGKLEMISFWLLCWKLLRATAGVRRTHGNELSEGCSHTQNLKQKEDRSEAVTMETSQLSEMAPVHDCKMDSMETETAENKEKEDNQIRFDTDISEATKAESMREMVGESLQDETAFDNQEGTRDGQQGGTDLSSQGEILVIKTGQDELNRTESVTSSVSDTPSSTGSVYENELMHNAQHSPEQEQPDSPTPTNESRDDDVSETVEHEVSKQETLPESESQNETQETILEQQIREEVVSDNSNESCHDPDQEDDLSDCLQVEIAVVSSDSETDENWRAIFSSTVHKEGSDDLFLDGGQEANLGEPLDQKDMEAQKCCETDEAETGASDILEQPEPPGEPLSETHVSSYDTSANLHSLSKISEDEEESGPGAKPSSHTTKTDPAKRVPSDYCVIQETKSENVSTEHVNFRVAREQWLQIEEQTKCQVQQATAKQGTCQGGHSFMYTPVRTIDKPKKDTELDSLGLSEYPYTQFSPCSEDSGLDDSSYRSAYDEPETPIEREIRLELEREESHRRERGLSKAASPGENTQAKARPASLLPGKHDKGLPREAEEKRGRTFGIQEDSYRLQSPGSSKLPPSFSLSSSPSAAKTPLYHEMAANNVIILEPGDSYPTSPRHSAKGSPGPPLNRKFNEWPSETTSVIILETSNLIIRSASEFCLNTACQETQESTFVNNPFFKLRSRSTQSLVDQEIKVVKQREEELRRQRAQLYTKEKYDTVLVSPNLLDNLCLDRSAELPVRCKSSPSSPLKTARKMDRSTLSCDHKYTDTFSGARRKSAMAMRWEAGEFAKREKQ